MFDARASSRIRRDHSWLSARRCARAAARWCAARAGGAHVFAVNASSAAELRVRLSVRARAGLADVYQHPAPRAPDDFREGARYRYVPRGEEGAGRRRGNADRTNQNQKHQKHQKLLWSEHAVPAGRARLLAVAVATGPSESRRHALDVRARPSRAVRACAVREARRARAEPNDGSSARAKRVRRTLASSFAESGASPPPPGAATPRSRALAARSPGAPLRSGWRRRRPDDDDDDGADGRGDKLVVVDVAFGYGFGKGMDRVREGDGSRRGRGGVERYASKERRFRRNRRGRVRLGIRRRSAPRRAAHPLRARPRVRVRAASRGGERGDARQVRKDRVSGT